MMKRTAIAVIVFASQATLAIAQSTHTMDRRVVNPDDSGYRGGWGQNDGSRAATATAPRASVTPTIAIDGSTVNPEDSGYRGPGG